MIETRGDTMQKEDVIIIGGGPCGLATAIALKENGLNPLVIEKGNIVNAIHHYPTHQTFFSTSEKLEIGDIPFIIENRKPVRSQALAYYREVVRRKQLRIHSYEKVGSVEKKNEAFIVRSVRADGTDCTYISKYVVVATGYYDHPNELNVTGEKLDKVFHYFKEAHPFFDKDVVVIGGKNSAVDAALELERAGARVTVLYRGHEYSPSIKPWILPEFESLVKNGLVTMHFNSKVICITENEVKFEVDGKETTIKNDFVFAMIGYHPDHKFLRTMGVLIEPETGRPIFNNNTMETNIKGIYIAGVIAAGNNANEIFIENGRFHGGLIATSIKNSLTP
jgi:thioredoxin reductase (NADPH)